jgi:hypothetical protein
MQVDPALFADLAAQARRLKPDWRNPERYFLDHDELVRRLDRLAEGRG